MCHQPNQNNGFSPRGFQHGPQILRGPYRGPRFQNLGRGSFPNLRVNFPDYGPRPPPQGYNQGQNNTQYGQQTQGNRGGWNGAGRGVWNRGNQRPNWNQGQPRGNFTGNQRGNWSQNQRIRSIDHHESENEYYQEYPYPEIPSQQSSSTQQSNVVEEEEDNNIQDDFYTAVRSIKLAEK